MQSSQGGKVTPSGSPGAWPRGSRAAEGGRSAGPESRFCRPSLGHKGPYRLPGDRDSWPVLSRAPCRQLPTHHGPLGGLASGVFQPAAFRV